MTSECSTVLVRPSHLLDDCNFPVLGIANSFPSPPLFRSVSPMWSVYQAKGVFLPPGTLSHTFSCSLSLAGLDCFALCFQNIYWICLGLWGRIHTWDHMNTHTLLSWKCSQLFVALLIAWLAQVRILVIGLCVCTHRPNHNMPKEELS